MASNGQSSNFEVPLKMADFLLTSHHGVHRPFCASRHDEGVDRVLSGYGKMTPFVRWRYKAILRRQCSRMPNCFVSHHDWRPCQNWRGLAEVLGPSQFTARALIITPSGTIGPSQFTARALIKQFKTTWTWNLSLLYGSFKVLEICFYIYIHSGVPWPNIWKISLFI